MTLSIDLPGHGGLDLEFLLLDVNGTLSNRGVLIAGVEERIRVIRSALEVRLLSADTFTTLDEIADTLGVRAEIAPTAAAKNEALHGIGAQRCIAIGNGANDVGMIRDAALGIAILGEEGCSSAALIASDIVCRSIVEALDLLREPKALSATLRS